MNSNPRVLLIGRHFWPHGSIDAAGSLIQLASGLQHRGLGVEVLTPRYASTWPTSFCFREIMVHRPVSAPKSDWMVGRYTRQTASWIRDNASAFDVLLVHGGREEAIAAIEAARSLKCRSIVRIDGFGRESDLNWWNTSRAARRCAAFVKTADRIVVSDTRQQRELISRGFSPSNVERIEYGFTNAHAEAPSDRAEASNQRVEARRALAAINGDLRAPADEPVAMCVTSMQRDCGVDILVESARHLVARYPLLHLWLIGDGPQRDAIFHTLRGDGIRASIAMPGSFGDMSDVYAAADLYVHTDESCAQHALRTAAAHALPIVACDDALTRAVLQPAEQDSPQNGSDGPFSDALVH